MMNVYGQQPWDGNNNLAATLDQGHLPNTMLGSDSILTISLAISLYLHLDNYELVEQPMIHNNPNS